MISLPSYGIEDETVQVITALSNNFRLDFKDNVSENDKLAVKLDLLCKILEYGVEPPNSTISYVLHKAMETTRSDPNARKGSIDYLRDYADKVFALLMFENRNASLLYLRLRAFQRAFNHALRRHYMKRDDYLLYAMKIIYERIQKVAITTDVEDESKKEKRFFDRF